jgi:hypothetical protein
MELIHFIILIAVILLAVWIFFPIKEGFPPSPGQFDLVPSQQLIEITDNHVNPQVLVVMPNTVVVWKNSSSHSIKLFIDIQGGKKMVVIDQGETWSYPYTLIRQYEYRGGYLQSIDENNTRIDKFDGGNSFIYGRVIVTGI